MDFPPLLHSLLLSFLPLFFAIGALDFVPIYVGMTQGMKDAERRRVLRQAMLVALAILAGFLLLGKGVLLLMGVSVGDFTIAGGLLLLVLSVRALVMEEPPSPRRASKDIGIVPLATPLIAGPAAITSTFILLDRYGSAVTLASIVLNIAAAWTILAAAPLLRRLLGAHVLRALGKLSYILLASIAVMMIRRGLTAAP